MKILDVDMDYFLYDVAHFISQDSKDRLENSYEVWKRENIIDFIENNLGLSKNNKIKGKIVEHHNEALYYWKELIDNNLLETPFEVIHVDSHADLGLGDKSLFFIFEKLLGLNVDRRINFQNYGKYFEEYSLPGIGDYLLFTIAFRWISKLTYISNPNSFGDDYHPYIMKNFDDFSGIIQLSYNDKSKISELPNSFNKDAMRIKENYLKTSILEPEVPFEIKRTIEGVKYNGDFDFITFCISPNYTPKSADFIIDIFREYIEEN